MEINNIIIIVSTLILFLTTSLIIASSIFLYKIKHDLHINVQDLDTLMNIIDTTIKRTFLEKYKLEYELRNMTMIKDFEKDLNQLTHAVIMSFNKPFMTNLEYYYSKEYIIGYVTKTIQIMLMEFIKEKKLKIK